MSQPELVVERLERDAGDLLVRDTRRQAADDALHRLQQIDGPRRPAGATPRRATRSTRYTSAPRSRNTSPIPVCDATASRFARIDSNASPSVSVCR